MTIKPVTLLPILVYNTYSQYLAAIDPPIECPAIMNVGSGYFSTTNSKTS